MLNIKNRKTPEIIAEFSGFLLLQGSIKVTIIEYLKNILLTQTSHIDFSYAP
jgi:hypothetical protein